MPDIIELLPDTVANQIAAGEVIQRPASAVKELLENSIDAHSTLIKLIVKDSGKTLIQVSDNGSGMSGTDARMCFERHATSKIRSADDLFNIRTMGFRGEGLASIAAISQVEMKTRKRENDTGTFLEIEGGKVIKQELCACTEGTSIAVKNLFFNVPARRNFLKSDTIELRHIIEEFQRVSIAHPGIHFSFHHNNSEVYNLEKGNMRQRIVSLFGKSHNERIAPVEEVTDIVKVSGFVGKPEFAKKTRGEQFFFVNKRFIKSPYLHHAVQSAYQQLLASDSYPSYFLMLEVDPKTIDVNIHPTKTEIKFEEEKYIYTILHSAVKKSLGQYNIVPSLDFEQEMGIKIPYDPNRVVEQPKIRVNPDYNPFETKRETPREQSNAFNWEKLYTGLKNNYTEEKEPKQKSLDAGMEENKSVENQEITFQLHRKYIISSIKSGLVIIDQQGAHERILYEKYSEMLEKQISSSQQILFPLTIEMGPDDFELVREIKENIKAIGFNIEEFGKNTLIMHGIPTELGSTQNPSGAFEKMIETYKQNRDDLKLEKKECLARSMAKTSCIKEGRELSKKEMSTLIDQLFACKLPYHSPNGKPTIITQTLEEIEKRFKK